MSDIKSFKQPEDYKNIFSLENKVAIVTGGAGHLGSSISKGLAALGANVILVGRTKKNLQDFIDQYQKPFKNKFEYFVCDVTKKGEFDKVVEKVISDHKTIDILVNNAYQKQNEKFEKLTLDQWDKAIEGSLTHYVFCTQTVSKIMLNKGKGSIINVSSIYGFLGTDPRIFLDLENCPGIDYSISKGGILQLTKYLSARWAPKGIRVNAISPGYFPKMKPGALERKDYMQEISKRTPMCRIGQPDEIAGAAIFLASDASSFMTGQNIIVDGGWSAW